MIPPIARRLAMLLAAFPLALPPGAGPARAQTMLEGEFVAGRDCEARLEIDRRGPAATHARLEVGEIYELAGIDYLGGDNYRIVVPEAPYPTLRWVGVDCGSVIATRERARSGHILAVGWPAADCLDPDGPGDTLADTPGCGELVEENPRATAFVLDALEPQPEDRTWCGLSAWLRDRPAAALPDPDIAPETREALARVLPPGQGEFHRLQWAKFGSCTTEEPDTYFRNAMGILRLVNESPVRGLFARRLGETLTASEVQIALERGHGNQSGERVAMVCEDGWVVGLRLALGHSIGPGADLGRAMGAADPLERDCLAGRVVPLAR